MNLIPITYHNLSYPDHIRSEIVEVAGHFDVQALNNDLEDYSFSLHTEYSASHRRMDSPCVNGLEAISDAQGNGERAVPHLWSSRQWAVEFAYFIICLLDGKKPKIIEIHPHKSRVSGLTKFIEQYEVFHNILLSHGIDSTILIENRNGFSLS